jgi:glutamate racemase
VGGLSVWREVARCIPDAPLVYLADQAHVPYGRHNLEDVRAFTVQCVGWLIAHGCHVVVVACNTASGAALDVLRETFPHTPIVGMEPAVKPAALRTQTGVIGVLATPVTFQSHRYADLVHKWADGLRVIEQTCPGWVEAVERGGWMTEKGAAGPARTVLPTSLIADSVLPLLDQNADTLVLGCTHFPFLRAHIEQVIDDWRAVRPAAPEVAIIDPAPAVAQQTMRVWQQINPKGLQAPSSFTPHEFWTTGDAARLEKSIQALLGVWSKGQDVII